MTIIKEFLVAIGYTENIAQRQSFQRSLTSTNKLFTQLEKTALAAASTVVASLAAMSKELDHLYFVSIRTKASADNLAAFAYAARQTGVSADAAAGSIENMASRIRRMPGLQGLLGNMGINGRGDPIQIAQQLHQRLANRPMWVQLQYADLFGIDEKTWLVLRQMGQFIDQRRVTAQRLGVDMQVAAKSGNMLWTSLRQIYNVMSLIATKVIQEGGAQYSKYIKSFSEAIIQNAPLIRGFLETVVKFFVKILQMGLLVGEAFIKLVQYTKDWYNGLDEGGKAAIKVFAALLVAWKALSVAFMLTPLGRLVALLGLFALLIDDFMTFKKFGKDHSYFDWSYLAEDKGGFMDWIKRMFGVNTPGGKPGGAAAGGKPAPSPSLFDHGRIRANVNDADVRKRVRDTYNGLIKAGLTPSEAAGFMAALDRETGGSFDPTSYNPRDSDGKPRWGMLQWDRERSLRFKSIYGVMPNEGTIEQQTAFMAQEFKRRGVREKIRTGTGLHGETPFDAGKNITSSVVQPYDPNGGVANQDGLNAQAWANLFNAHPSIITPNSPTTQSGGAAPSITIAPNTNISVSGTGSPEEVAGRIADHQRDINQEALRNSRVIVQ